MRALLALLAAVVIAATCRAQDVDRTAPWTRATVELAAGLPVQDGGRVKPLETFAGTTLLALSGKRSLTTPDGERLGPVEWLLDTLFFPERASYYAVFLVQDDAVLDALDLTIEGRQKRDRYSYEELRAGVPRLFDLAHRYGALEERERSSVQQQVLLLAGNMDVFARFAGRPDQLACAAPAEAGADAWWTPAELWERYRAGEYLVPAHGELLEAMRALGAVRADPAAFEREFGVLVARAQALARERGLLAPVELELDYLRWRLVPRSLMLFVLAFLGAAGCWVLPRNRAVYRVTCALVTAGALALVAAIVVRCLIRGRPPVTTLYETVLFVTATGTLIALFVEAVDRKRIAVSAAAILGTIGLFVANGYELLDKSDTMPSLVAVLDTNFWLATHVTAITLGYSAGMLAALLGSLYLLAKLFRWRRGDRALYTALSRTVYGVVCFGLFFSIVGTILGGIWANDSWGRFWGWDPKENGALLIVISQIAILHGRMGGWLREHGVCAAAAFGGTVVAFSWWGVNLLGVGLHSYGFTSGVHRALWTYYGLQWGLVAAGTFAWLRDRAAARRTSTSTEAASEIGAPEEARRAA